MTVNANEIPIIQDVPLLSLTTLERTIYVNIYHDYNYIFKHKDSNCVMFLKEFSPLKGGEVDESNAALWYIGKGYNRHRPFAWAQDNTLYRIRREIG